MKGDIDLRVLFDTTALYVAAGLSNLTFTSRTQRLLDDPDTVRMISPVSIIEIAIKSNKRLASLTVAHVEQLIIDLALTVLPLTEKHAYRMFGLAAHHNDPFDRMLIAIALSEDVVLLAHDREFKRYRGLRVIW